MNKEMAEHERKFNSPECVEARRKAHKDLRSINYAPEAPPPTIPYPEKDTSTIEQEHEHERKIGNSCLPHAYFGSDCCGCLYWSDDGKILCNECGQSFDLEQTGGSSPTIAQESDCYSPQIPYKGPSTRLVVQTIAQELEAGLKERLDEWDLNNGPLPKFTRIFLPAAKFNEFMGYPHNPEQCKKGRWQFHGVPLIRVDDPNFTEIHYCTD